MPKVVIKIRAFPYYEDVENPVSGKKERKEIVGRRGQEIDLSDTDYERAVRFDAIVKEGESPDPDDGDLPQFPEDVEIEAASIEQLSNWIVREKPTIEEVVEAADDDSVNARKLIEAENHATGQQPRKGLIEALQQIITDAEGTGA